MFDKYDNEYYYNLSQDIEIDWPNYFVKEEEEKEEKEEEFTIIGDFENKIINEDIHKEKYFDKLNKNYLIENKKIGITSKENQNPSLNLNIDENKENLIKKQIKKKDDSNKYYNDSKSKNKLLGRKRKDSNEKGNNNKYS